MRTLLLILVTAAAVYLVDIGDVSLRVSPDAGAHLLEAARHAVERVR